MKKIKEFNNLRKFNTYLEENKSRVLGYGVEGIAYLSKSNETIKDMQDIEEPIFYTDNPDIIMSDDLDLSSFIFPKELFLIGNQIVGYRSDYFAGNIIKKRNGKIEDIDIDALLEARERFIEDLRILTKEGYQLYDVAGNLLFDNKTLVAIDTLDYKRRRTNLDKNIQALDNGLARELKLHDPSTHIGVFDNFQVAIQKIKSKK